MVIGLGVGGIKVWVIVRFVSRGRLKVRIGWLVCLVSVMIMGVNMISVMLKKIGMVMISLISLVIIWLLKLWCCLIRSCVSFGRLFFVLSNVLNRLFSLIIIVMKLSVLFILVVIVVYVVFVFILVVSVVMRLIFIRVVKVGIFYFRISYNSSGIVVRVVNNGCKFDNEFRFSFVIVSFGCWSVNVVIDCE